ncbi:RecX family transcriptional regulator [Acetobacter sp. TBRC 12305]|uniref:Regulatory protein RecX n=1 Tax=Acetobacter garciniae TaxID=2817435 RepID=A0A939KQK1_9PROT|nr:RecX family transcriptional regulator [Acetobacter garciniae]MBO1323741.1 RecX family transcriptional regulator [Acetobacter garciniae]MBX0343430.1 RecX family transcriptional regulator [Acetobacter garciniae]
MNSAAHPPSVPAAPDRSSLRQAALAHLARFGTTRHGLGQVLLRRVARWQRQAVAAGAEPDQADATARQLGGTVAQVVAEMVAAGAVDDSAFARSRVRRLTRSGRSGRAIAAHLAARGVEAQVSAQALSGDADSTPESALSIPGHTPLNATERDLCAAVVLARKRRLGPFNPAAGEDTQDPFDDDTDGGGNAPRANARAKALGVLARAGFARDTAERVLDMDPEEAQDWLERLKGEP